MKGFKERGRFKHAILFTDDRLYERLIEVAERNKISVAETIRRCIKFTLDDLDRKRNGK